MPRRRHDRDGLFKRGQVWYVRTDPVTGRELSTGCRDEQAAKLWRAERERRAADPAYAAAQATSCNDAVSRFLLERKLSGCIEETLTDYRSKAGHWLRIAGQQTPLAEAANKTALVKYLSTRLEEGSTRRGLKKEYAVVRMLLSAAHGRGDTPLPLDRIAPDFDAPYEPGERALSREEAFALLWYFCTRAVTRGSRYRFHRAAWIAFVLGTGARLSEANRAERADIDLANGRVLIRGTKTRRAWKVVPIVPGAEPLLAFALEHGGASGTKGFV